MLEIYFFVLGLVNSVFLTIIFLLRKNKLHIVKKIGWTYLLLAIPALGGIFLVIQENKSLRYALFLTIFIAFLFFEWLLDYYLKINFRENMKKHLKWVVPYLVLYYMMNYGFIVMPWKTSIVWGIVMISLFAIQIIANINSHPKIGK
ncbi:MAG: YwiC-like family protein [Dehalococcoidaceae bacterium]|nr:YwiC-like family protein [Dehalococcoidaceae bacterium]